MRTKGAKTIKNCWLVNITQGDIVLHNGEYKTLKDAADDLGLSYSQICELGPNGRNKKKSIRFKFMPKIEITKLDKVVLDTIDLIDPEIKDIFSSKTTQEAIDKVNSITPIDTNIGPI